MPTTIKITEIDPLIKKIKDTNEPLTGEDRVKIGELLDASGSTIAVLNEQVETLKFSLEIWKDGAAAAATHRTAVLNTLRIIAPPVASIDVDKAIEDAAILRQDIENSTNLVNTITSGIRFAVKCTGIFV